MTPLDRDMLDCQDVRAFIDTYIDGEFEAQEHAEIEVHLSQCLECRQIAGYRLQCKELVSRMHEPAPQSLRDKICACLNLEDAAATRLRQTGSFKTGMRVTSDLDGSKSSQGNVEALGQLDYLKNDVSLTKVDQEFSLTTEGCVQKLESSPESKHPQEVKYEVKREINERNQVNEVNYSIKTDEINKVNKVDKANGFLELEKSSDMTSLLTQKAHNQPLSSSSSSFFSQKSSSTTAIQKFAMALAAVLAIGLVFVLGQHFTVAPATTHNLSVWEESVDWYRADFPMEVQGPDPRKVSDWFRGKVNFRVDPLSFVGKGQDPSKVVLKGGRLASVHNRRAALLAYNVYDVDVTLLIFDGKGLTIPAENVQTIDGQQIAIAEGPGYDVALFQKDGLTYMITTDLASARFESLLKNVLSAN